MGAQQWSNAQDSLLGLEKNNVASLNEIVRSVTYYKNLFEFYCSRALVYIYNMFLFFSIGEEWKPIKAYVHGFLLPCHLHLKMQTLQARISFPQSIVSF